MPRGFEYNTINGVTTDEDGFITGPVNLIGYLIRESAGTAAAYEVNIVDGQSASAGVEVVFIEGPGNTSETQFFDTVGIFMPNGISLEVISGEVDCTVYFKRF